MFATGSWERRPDVVIVVLESFRADMVGLHHNGRPVTPVLNAIASRGISAKHAYSHNGYTAPSRYHLLTGALLEGRNGHTLIDDFKRNGYVVGYFSGQDETFGNAEHAVALTAADVVFDARADRDRRYSTFTTAGSLAIPFDVVQERLGAFLDSHGATAAPMFVYVNFHDTHFPYAHEGVRPVVSEMRLPRGAIAPGRRDDLWATYVNTAANVDRAVGEALDAIERARGRRPAVIVTADHGESLFDEGFLGHGYALNEVQTRVPLIVEGLPVRVAEPFGQIDLRQTIDRALREGIHDAPELTSPEGKEVFQYLGNLPRPRQIAVRRIDARTTYDFRTRRVRFGDGAWRPVETLTRSERADFLRLVHTWERMMLARGKTAGAGS
jgi:arylsulfatase A-like enzyme